MEKIEISRRGLTAVGCDFKNQVVRVELADGSESFILKPEQLRELSVNHNCQIKVPGTNRYIGRHEISRITTYTNHDNQKNTFQPSLVVITTPSAIAS